MRDIMQSAPTKIMNLGRWFHCRMFYGNTISECDIVNPMVIQARAMNSDGWFYDRIF